MPEITGMVAVYLVTACTAVGLGLTALLTKKGGGIAPANGRCLGYRDIGGGQQLLLDTGDGWAFWL